MTVYEPALKPAKCIVISVCWRGSKANCIWSASAASSEGCKYSRTGKRLWTTQEQAEPAVQAVVAGWHTWPNTVPRHLDQVTPAPVPIFIK